MCGKNTSLRCQLKISAYILGAMTALICNLSVAANKSNPMDQLDCIESFVSKPHSIEMKTLKGRQMAYHMNDDGRVTRIVMDGKKFDLNYLGAGRELKVEVRDADSKELINVSTKSQNNMEEARNALKNIDKKLSHCSKGKKQNSEGVVTTLGEGDGYSEDWGSLSELGFPDEWAFEEFWEAEHEPEYTVYIEDFRAALEHERQKLREEIRECIDRVETCGSGCDGASTRRQVVCFATGGIVGILNVYAGLAVGAACLVGDTIMKDSCKNACGSFARCF